MKRITEFNKEDCHFNLDTAEAYLQEVKSSSQARYSNFFTTLKRMKIKGRYLDVGCGPGLLTQEIAKQHPDVEIIGIDNSAEMLELARQELPDELKARIRFAEGDACNIDFINELGKFDLIYSTFALHHWNDAEAVIRNLYSSLNNNGILYIHDLKRVLWLYYIKSDSGFFKSIRASYRPDELRKLLSNIGIRNYRLKAIFPFFMQSILIRR